jgi:heat shock protein HslJ
MTITFMSSCAWVGTQNDPLNGTKWRLIELGSTPAIDGRAPTMNFEAGSVRGSAGCNSFQGIYSVSGQQIDFDELAMTLMACPDDEGVMEQERRFFSALQGVERFELSGTELVLSAVDGSSIILAAE